MPVEVSGLGIEPEHQEKLLLAIPKGEKIS